MINHALTYQGKPFFFISSFHLVSSLLLKDLKLTQMIETKEIGNILKAGREKLIDFRGTCHGKLFLVSLCWLRFFKGRYRLSKFHEKHGICTPYPHPNQPPNS